MNKKKGPASRGASRKGVKNEKVLLGLFVGILIY